MKVKLFLLLYLPQFAYANVCHKLFPRVDSVAATANQILFEMQQGKNLNTESLYQLTDILTSSQKMNSQLYAKTQELLRSLGLHASFQLRMSSFELLTYELKASANFYDFFKTKLEVEQYLEQRRTSFLESDRLPTANEILNVFMNHTQQKPLRLEDYILTFDYNGHFYISKAELNKVLNQSPIVYAQLLRILKAVDSRIEPESLVSLLSNPKIIENHELIFKPTLQAIEQQGLKPSISDLKLLLSKLDTQTNQALILTDILSYMGKRPSLFLNELVGEKGMLVPLLAKVDLSNAFGRILYQQLFVTLSRFKYEMTQEELNLSFSLLLNYKPMPFNTQTRLTSLLRHEFESPLEIFYNYLASQNQKLILSQKNYALSVLRHNVSSSAVEQHWVVKFESLLEGFAQ